MHARRRLFGLVGLSALLLGLAIYAFASMARERRVTGSWRGEFDRGWTASLTIQQSATGLTGSGIFPMELGCGSNAVLLTGTYVKPTVSLNITSGRCNPRNYTGTLDGGRIVGTVGGYESLTLERQ